MNILSYISFLPSKKILTHNYRVSGTEANGDRYGNSTDVPEEYSEPCMTLRWAATPVPPQPRARTLRCRHAPSHSPPPPWSFPPLSKGIIFSYQGAALFWWVGKGLTVRRDRQGTPGRGGWLHLWVGRCRAAGLGEENRNDKFHRPACAGCHEQSHKLFSSSWYGPNKKSGTKTLGINPVGTPVTLRALCYRSINSATLLTLCCPEIHSWTLLSHPALSQVWARYCLTWADRGKGQSVKPRNKKQDKKPKTKQKQKAKKQEHHKRGINISKILSGHTDFLKTKNHLLPLQYPALPIQETAGSASYCYFQRLKSEKLLC